MKVQVTTKFACDFCGQTEDQVAQLLTGPRSIAICNDCIEVCNKTLDAIAKEKAAAKAGVVSAGTTDRKYPLYDPITGTAHFPEEGPPSSEGSSPCKPERSATARR